jgi:cell division septal protein FtsQ
MADHKEIERKEKKADSSKVGVAFIKYLTYLIIFFGFLWFLISYVFPMF